MEGTALENHGLSQNNGRPMKESDAGSAYHFLHPPIFGLVCEVDELVQLFDLGPTHSDGQVSKPDHSLEAILIESGGVTERALPGGHMCFAEQGRGDVNLTGWPHS